MAGLLVVWLSSVYHSTIFCYSTLLERCNTLIPDALSKETAELRWESNRGERFKVRYTLTSTQRRLHWLNILLVGSLPK